MRVGQNHSLDFALSFAVESFKVLLVALEGLHREWIDISKCNGHIVNSVKGILVNTVGIIFPLSTVFLTLIWTPNLYSHQLT